MVGPETRAGDVRGHDAPLYDALRRWTGSSAEDAAESVVERVERIERTAHSPEVTALAKAANTNRPRLSGRFEVTYDPAWHHLLELAVGFGLHGTPWTSSEPGRHLARAAGFYVWSQAEAGHGCPISMTYAAIPALRAPGVERSWSTRWVEGLAAQAYAPGLLPAADKPGLLAGMTMTERQGGSDLRAVRTIAEERPDGTYALTGEKWFCSAPMCDVFLVLARAPGGPTCFLVPRVRPDGTLNAFEIQRLKEKLGNASNASAEIALSGALGWRLGAEGRGLPTILAAVASTRLDCVLGSAALMRRSLVEAWSYARERHAFGGPLVDKPVMQGVLADLALDSEAATTLGLRLAHAIDDDERDLLRLALPAAKYLVCKATPGFVAEALECFGGNGYTSDSPMPLLYRESPLNSIWEGSGSVQALDVVRALQRSPEALAAWITEVGPAIGTDVRLDAAVDELLETLGELGDDPALEGSARRLAERFALLLQAELLVRYAPPEVSSAFCLSRLGGGPSYAGFGGRTYGTLPRQVDPAAILDRRHRTEPDDR